MSNRYQIMNALLESIKSRKKDKEGSEAKKENASSSPSSPSTPPSTIPSNSENLHEHVIVPLRKKKKIQAPTHQMERDYFNKFQISQENQDDFYSNNCIYENHDHSEICDDLKEIFEYDSNKTRTTNKVKQLPGFRKIEVSRDGDDIKSNFSVQFERDNTLKDDATVRQIFEAHTSVDDNTGKVKKTAKNTPGMYYFMIEMNAFALIKKHENVIDLIAKLSKYEEKIIKYFDFESLSEMKNIINKINENIAAFQADFKKRETFSENVQLNFDVCKSLYENQKNILKIFKYKELKEDNDLLNNQRKFLETINDKIDDKMISSATETVKHILLIYSQIVHYISNSGFHNVESIQTMSLPTFLFLVNGKNNMTVSKMQLIFIELLNKNILIKSKSLVLLEITDEIKTYFQTFAKKVKNYNEQFMYIANQVKTTYSSITNEDKLFFQQNKHFSDYDESWEFFKNVMHKEYFTFLKSFIHFFQPFDQKLNGNIVSFSQYENLIQLPEKIDKIFHYLTQILSWFLRDISPKIDRKTITETLTQKEKTSSSSFSLSSSLTLSLLNRFSRNSNKQKRRTMENSKFKYSLKRNQQQQHQSQPPQSPQQSQQSHRSQRKDVNEKVSSFLSKGNTNRYNMFGKHRSSNINATGGNSKNSTKTKKATTTKGTKKVTATKKK